MTDITPAATITPAAALRRLYFIRFVFALVWAAILFASAAAPGPVLTTLLIVYPLADAIAVFWQLRAEGSNAGPKVAEWLNVVLSVAAAIGLGIASSVSLSAVLATWGAWAILSGITQLITAIFRRRTGGQIPLIISGAISVLAGSGFLFQGLSGGTGAAGIGGYALFGGVLFLIAAIRLGIVMRKRS